MLVINKTITRVHHGKSRSKKRMLRKKWLLFGIKHKTAIGMKCRNMTCEFPTNDRLLQLGLLMAFEGASVYYG